MNQQNEKLKEKNLAVNVHCGVFGNRQGLKIESDGPFTHSFDINMVESKKKAKEASEKKEKPKKSEEQRNDSSDKSASNASATIDEIIGMLQSFS